MPFYAPDPSHVIKAAIAQQRNMKRGSVSFDFKTTIHHQTVTVHGSVNFIKDLAATVHLQQQALGKESDRIYHVQGSKFSAYDYYSDQAIHRFVPSTQSLGKRFSFALGVVPDPVEASIDSDWFASFLYSVQKGKHFTETPTSNGVTLKARGPGQFDSLQLWFDKSNRMTGFKSQNGLSSFQWSLSYSPSYHPAAIPTGGAEVKVFAEHAPPPTFASQDARAICLAASRAFRNLKPAKVVVDRPGKKSVVYWDAGKVRQNSSSSTWAYNGQVLTVLVRGKFFRGKANHADALDYLAYLTGGEDSFARTLLMNGNVLQSFLSPTDTVRVAGKMNLGGAPATLLEVTGPGGRSHLTVRNSDHMVLATDTDNFGTDGKVAFHDECQYRYLPFHPDSSLFTLKSSKPAKPMPKAAISMGSKYYHPELQFQSVPVKRRRKVRGQ